MRNSWPDWPDFAFCKLQLVVKHGRCLEDSRMRAQLSEGMSMTSMTHGADFTRFETWKAKNTTFFARKKAVGVFLTF